MSVMFKHTHPHTDTQQEQSFIVAYLIQLFNLNKSCQTFYNLILGFVALC